MKLFIIIVVSVIVYCNAQGDSLRAVQLLEAILNETRVARYQSLQRSLAQENALNELIDKVETTSTQLVALINEIKNTRLDQNTCCNITNDSLGHIYNELHSARQEAQDYHEVAQQWYTQPNVFVSFASCEDIKTMSPSAPSGYYNITKYDGTTQRVFCDIEHSHLSCNGTEHSHQCGTASIEYCGSTGWTRVAYLNMSDPSQQCPNELRLYNESGVRACGRNYSSIGSCDNVTFSTGKSYSQVCGRVIGYQFGSPDALFPWQGHVLIDSPYVEGISITHGPPRQHIWTLMNGQQEAGTGDTRCPCNNGSTVIVPSFIGDDYFCESGSPSDPTSQLYTDDPLWDGEGCGGDEGHCCNVPGIPWFHKVLNTTTSDDIELRVCGDYKTDEEDVPVSLYEIYVK